ncbi:MAG: hypothetical protein LBU12_01515 [Deltaproteobacteria bacterium]|jgi:glycerol uptake facilitator-like aquaporin|nr:hypothetical protein [Deltaproteobacteria bacterium]
MKNSSWGREFLDEFGGTFLMIFFGVGSVQAAVLTGAQVGLRQAAEERDVAFREMHALKPGRPAPTCRHANVAAVAG